MHTILLPHPAWFPPKRGLACSATFHRTSVGPSVYPEAGCRLTLLAPGPACLFPSRLHRQLIYIYIYMVSTSQPIYLPLPANGCHGIAPFRGKRPRVTVEWSDVIHDTRALAAQAPKAGAFAPAAPKAGAPKAGAFAPTAQKAGAKAGTFASAACATPAACATSAAGA